MPNSKQAFPLLDLIRFGAALLVLFGHTRGLFFVRIADVTEPSIVTLAFYLSTSLHHEAVIIFFVLSGFLVGGPLWQRLGDGTFDPRTYAIDRFSRIYIVYVPALIVTAIAVTIGQNLFADTRFYAERPLFPSGVSDGWTWAQVACHAVSVQGVFCAPWGQNPPLWSLGYEWVFYVIAPVMFLATFKIHRLLPSVPPIVAAAGIYYVVRVWILPIYYVDCWFIGVVAFWICRTMPLPMVVGLGGLVSAAGFMVVSRLDVLPRVENDLAIAASIALALCAPSLIARSFAPRLWKHAADMSYSLYVLHLPLGVLIGGAMASMGVVDELALPGSATAMAFAITVLAAFSIAYLFARATEARTDRLRRRLKGLLLTRYSERPTHASEGA